jgi:hypothetical protein
MHLWLVFGDYNTMLVTSCLRKHPSEIDYGRFRHIGLEKLPKSDRMRVGIPKFESIEFS